MYTVSTQILSKVWETSLSCFLLYFSWSSPYVCNSVSALMGLNIQLQTEPHPVLAMEIRSMVKMGARRWAKHSRGPMTQAPWLHCGSIRPTPPFQKPLALIHSHAFSIVVSGKCLRFNDYWWKNERKCVLCWEKKTFRMMVIRHAVWCLWWSVRGALSCLCTAPCRGTIRFILKSPIIKKKPYILLIYTSADTHLHIAWSMKRLWSHDKNHVPWTSFSRCLCLFCVRQHSHIPLQPRLLPCRKEKQDGGGMRSGKSRTRAGG